MGYTTKYGNYVKFLRGTPAAWQSIDVKDSDTLYFIAEDGADKGKLYLGSKLIADGNSATFLKDLEDIMVAEGIPTNSLLVYDGLQEKWVNKTLQEVMSLVVDVMIGATADNNGTAGLVPTPLAGQQDLYLKGSGEWANPTAQVEQSLNVLDQKVDKNAQDFRDEIAGLRGGKTGTITDIATDLVDAAVANLVANAPESFNTLKEIADWINQHDSVINIADIVVKVDKHEKELYGADGTSGLVSVVSNLDSIVNDPATGLKVQFSAIQGTMNGVLADITDLNRDVTNINNEITNIKALLQWIDMVDDGIVT